MAPSIEASCFSICCRFLHKAHLSPLQIANAPYGTQALTLDISAFHRTAPVHLAHKPYLIIQTTPGSFYMDHATCFGFAGASSNAGQASTATIDIWYSLGVKPCNKYEDNIALFRIPSKLGRFLDDKSGLRYDYDAPKVKRLIKTLKVPFHDKKGTLVFVIEFPYIGFFWEIPLSRVSLTLEKQMKFWQRVVDFLRAFSSSPCKLIDVEKIHGSLCHITFVYTDGRSFLPALSTFGAQFHSNSFRCLHPHDRVLRDLKWWRARLETPGIFRILTPLPPIKDDHIFVDASTSWGIGILISHRWAAYKLVPN